jgi:hypothetical protein
MLTGHPPFYSTDRTKMFNYIRIQKVKFHEFHSLTARDLLTNLLIKDSQMRLFDPDAIRNHDFYKGVIWDMIMLKKV